MHEGAKTNVNSEWLAEIEVKCWMHKVPALSLL